MAVTEESEMLRQLWRKRAQILTSSIALGGRDHREIAHASSLIRQDYHDRFLVELLQNANDQALRGKRTDSTVVVVLSENLLAVSNGGQGVTLGNLERLSSLADSDKDGVLVGNKGVGFKAVYQVTDAPEIYSAGQDTGKEQSVCSAFGLGFALENEPFSCPELVAAIDDDVREYLAANPGVRESFASRSAEDPVELIRRELKHVAGFKFPLERTNEDLARRIEELRIPEKFQPSMQTLVILPLRDQKARDDAKRALNRFLGDDGAEDGQVEPAMLFLRGIGRVVVLSQVEDSQRVFHRTPIGEVTTPQRITVSITSPDRPAAEKQFWLLRRDALDCTPEIAGKRKGVIAKAIREFGLEAWTVDDPIAVTIALPVLPDGSAASLGAPGRFCLGLPTRQSTGLPVHVDSRFSAKISRTDLEFSQDYNEVLLSVAIELFGDLLDYLRRSGRLEDRRTVTLAFERTKGVLADRVFAPGGLAEGDVVLTWNGTTFLPAKEVGMPSEGENRLLPFLCAAREDAPDAFDALPEKGLLSEAFDVLKSIELPTLKKTPHPWLDRRDGEETGQRSLIESACVLNRASGPSFWSAFLPALLDCFSAEEMETQFWLPVGTTELARPDQRVFLPPASHSEGDDEEVTNVPPRVAARIRLFDGEALSLREGRDLTPLALRLDKEKIIRRPRKTELLETALFPALAEAAQTDDEIAIELFGQAVAWVASMSPSARQKLECRKVVVPVASVCESGICWKPAREVYLGEGWGLEPEHDRLLGLAYPERRLLPLERLRDQIGSTTESIGEWRKALETMGVTSVPRVISYKCKAPFKSRNYRLQVVGASSFENARIGEIYVEYLHYLSRFRSAWSQQFVHNVDKTLWIDGLESAERRVAILELILQWPTQFTGRTSVLLKRVGWHDDSKSVTVSSMWAFALRKLGWQVFPGERGVGREVIRVSADNLWSLAAGDRRMAYARVVNVVPHSFMGAPELLRALGVPSLENAPIERLFAALTDFAQRLEGEQLTLSPDALSFAKELYRQIGSRLGENDNTKFPPDILVPLLRGRRLEAVHPKTNEGLIVLDDDPERGRHVLGIENAWRIPASRDAARLRLFTLFTRSFGSERVLRTSTAEITLDFKASSGDGELFLGWLQKEYPRSDVAVELAALLKYGNEDPLSADRFKGDWSRFEKLVVIFGQFRDDNTTSFYDRPSNKLWVSDSLGRHSVISTTWPLVGTRARDLWSGYARALEDDQTPAFLHERQITLVEMNTVADDAGLHRPRSIEMLSPALLAARRHIAPGTTLNEAATWLSGAGDSPEEVARSLEMPELTELLIEAVNLRSPEGDFLIVRKLDIPWPLWQEAVERRDGKPYTFRETELRFSHARAHLVAVAREIAVREPTTDLLKIGAVIAPILQADVPDAVKFFPPDAVNCEASALMEVRTALSQFEQIDRALAELEGFEAGRESLLPKNATHRGVRLFREVSQQKREIDARVSVEAVVEAAKRLAARFSEEVDSTALLSDPDLAIRLSGEWAHVYSAFAVVRQLLSAKAPETVSRLTEVHAFRETSTLAALLAKLPEIAEAREDRPPPKVSVLGVDLPKNEVDQDLRSGSAGTLGAKLVDAAKEDIATSILKGRRTPLRPSPQRNGSGGDGCGGGPRKGGSRRMSKEPEMTGDLGEAFVHEWLKRVLGDDYGPECWVSKSRERYGLPDCGEDNLGYDFCVQDPKGVLFDKPASKFLIEVKSTSTDGDGAFPMSRMEWEKARECHVANDDETYVILRVFEVHNQPRIGDVIIDPFAAHERGEIALTDRDLWVSVAPLVTK